MSMRNVSLTIVVLLAVCAIPAPAQDKLGDLLYQGGYEWILGKWAATTDEGNQIELEYKWGLDKHVILVDFKMGDFKLHGMIMYAASKEEITQVSADNKGGIWKGTWRDDYGEAVNRMEGTQADGETMKAELVHSKVDADTMKVAMYGVEDDGYRASEAWGTLNYKRQKK